MKEKSVEPITILGIDLAWGSRNPDGITVLRFENGIANPPNAVETSLNRGDEAFWKLIESLPQSGGLHLFLDAPLLCQNESGMRPVDRECNRLYRAYDAGCHPVNRKLCERPLALGDELSRRGFAITARASADSLTATEVYPHPATIRFFGLDRTIKYKKGRVAEKRLEFSRYQDHLTRFLDREMPWLTESEPHAELLSERWTKDTEDQVDSILCAAIGFWHLKYEGTRSEVLGDDESGHILIPRLV